MPNQGFRPPLGNILEHGNNAGRPPHSVPLGLAVGFTHYTTRLIKVIDVVACSGPDEVLLRHIDWQHRARCRSSVLGSKFVPAEREVLRRRTPYTLLAVSPFLAAASACSLLGRLCMHMLAGRCGKPVFENVLREKNELLHGMSDKLLGDGEQ